MKSLFSISLAVWLLPTRNASYVMRAYAMCHTVTNSTWLPLPTHCNDGAVLPDLLSLSLSLSLSISLSTSDAARS